MSLPPPLPDSSRWWRYWIAVVVGTPMMQVLGMWTGEKWRFDTLAVISFGLSLLAWGLHIYISIKLAQTIVAERAMIGRKASMGGLIAGLLLGGWASMFALFFCGCLAVMMTLG